MLHAYSFAVMSEKPNILERLDLQFRWGNYSLHVLRWHLTTFTPSHIIRLHKHSEFEFHFIPRGKGSVILDDQLFKLGSGMFYLTGPGVPHEQHADSKEGMDELCLHINIHKLPDSSLQPNLSDDWEQTEAETCIQLLNNYPSRPFFDDHEAMSCFLTAYNACRSGDIGSYTTIKQSLIQILVRTARAAVDSEVAIPLPARDIQAHRFQMVMQYIHDNYTNPLTLQEIADRIHISSRQLQRLFRKYRIESFNSYLEDYRLKRIKEDLARTLDSIESIAQRHGYVNSNYLFPVFKRKMGMTPLDYRLNYSNKINIR
jgi:AraC-like DNA-binding protein